MALDQWGRQSDYNRLQYGGWDPTNPENDPVPSSPTFFKNAQGQWVDAKGNLVATDANGHPVQPGQGGGIPMGAGGGTTPAAATPASGFVPGSIAGSNTALGGIGAGAGAAGAGAAAPVAGAGLSLAGTASKAIPWLELLYGIYKGQQKGKFQTPPTSPWQEKIFGKYYDWMTGGSPTNAALSPAIVENMRANNPEFTLPNLIGPEAGKNVLPNSGHVGGANIDWTALLQRLTAGGTPPATTPTNPAAMPADGVLGKKYDWMTP